MLLVSVSYFSQDLNYVSFEVFLINCTSCIALPLTIIRLYIPKFFLRLRITCYTANNIDVNGARESERELSVKEGSALFEDISHRINSTMPAGNATT